MDPILISSSDDDSDYSSDSHKRLRGWNTKLDNPVRKNREDVLKYDNRRIKLMAAEPSQKLIAEALKDLNNQPTIEAELPKGILSVSLLRHQKMALTWMLEKEKGQGVCNGGILADDQGLGKTISMISLIQMQRQLQQKHKSEKKKVPIVLIKPKPMNLEEADHKKKDIIIDSASSSVVRPKDVEEIPERIRSSRLFWERPNAGTLVVCPASVLRQWARELDEKVTEESKLSVLVYHGSKRTLDPVELAKYDVVLTTYALVTIEVQKPPEAGDGSKKRKRKNGVNSGGGTLGKVHWFRVILDEAHIIKNYKTKVAQACSRLRAKSRWCLSGTPLQNEIVELYSYFRFLRHDPYSDYKTFLSCIQTLKCTGSGYQMIAMVLRSIMLRRTKETVIAGKRILDLPPKMINLRQVELSEEERSFYDNLEQKFAWLFRFYVAKGAVGSNYARIMLMLLRLRQACDHTVLVKNAHKKVVRKESLETAKSLPGKKLESLLDKFGNSSSAAWGICRDTPESAVVSICGHVFCFECVLNHLTEKETATCPKAGCRHEIGVDGIFTEEILKECLPRIAAAGGSSCLSGGGDKEEVNEPPSSKIKAAIQVLQSCCKPSNPGSQVVTSRAKAIMFSQWTSMLDLVEKDLRDTGLKYRRLDGTMSLVARDVAVEDFNTNPEVDVMLMSLKAGNLGLNMVAATHVILLDPWWNPTTEDQAIDRAHRIGQTRPVTVTRLTIQNTVEDRILSLQEKKRQLFSAVIGEDENQGSRTRLSVQDLKHLFNVR
ncbi:OLC1v1009370C1 [Oldenlandia corymbosa var. corymbosa]|uniref:OLC1v1009370C1 n=1 Tax=Oldenlandia corymbosa var. corymbosa TaxID=529605 RepID=A0AAV1DNS0_OLDCO|nr:OLC1v1009370C1 [Oldenlandia corymbosa var. corymbosa]